MGWVGRVMAVVALPTLLALIAVIGQDSALDATEQVKTLLFIATLLFASQALTFYKTWRVYSGSRDRRSVDVTAKNRLVPDVALRLHSALEQLGFRRMGETDTPLPGRRESLTWLYVNGDASIHAELVAFSIALVQFNTVFADQAVLETSFPMGENMQRPNYRSVRVESGISEALDRHIEIAREMVLEHGRPMAIENVATYLSWGVIYRQTYTKMGKLGISFRRRLHGTLLAGYSVAWLALFWLVIQSQDGVTVEGLAVMGFLSVPPMVLALLN